MHCSLCVQHRNANGFPNEFIEGCGSYKIKPIKDHEEPGNHKWSDTLSDLLMIKLERTDIALFDPNPAYDLCGRMPWMSQKHADGLVTAATGSPKKKQKKADPGPDEQQQQRDLTVIGGDVDGARDTFSRRRHRDV